MQDRTSWSYRANLPGGNPDMYKEGGKAREAFREARTSPYIREHAQSQTGSSEEREDNSSRDNFRAKRRKPFPAPGRPNGPRL